MSTWTWFVKIWTVSNCEFNVNFLTFLVYTTSFFSQETIEVSYIVIWWLIFEKQFWRDIWIWVKVILSQLYLPNLTLQFFLFWWQFRPIRPRHVPSFILMGTNGIEDGRKCGHEKNSFLIKVIYFKALVFKYFVS